MAQRPQQIGPYPVLGVLGEGGMGSVYLSRDPELGCEVAIKILSAGRRATSAQRQRFQREVRALGQLRHPSLIELMGSGEERGVPWLAMRRVRGESLEDFLHTRASLSPAETIDLGVQIGSALAAAHAVGILHRDLKPDNVLRTPEGRYVLTDFGLTKELDRDESVRLSQTGVLQGTPGYWAPEQAEGAQSEWSFATDVYGLGALLYGALTGDPPIQGESLIEIVIQTKERVPDPPSRRVSGVPPELDQILLKCLEKSPSDRYPSVVEVVDALEQLLYASGQAPPRRTAWIVAGLGALLLGGLGAGVALAPGAPSPAPTASAPSATPAGDQGAALYAQAQAAQPGSARRELLQRAAALGHPGALYELGVALRESSPAEARGYFERAAEAGEARAMLAWGRALAEPTGRDPSAARRWLERAIEAGQLAGCNDLAQLCYSGRGGEVDEVRARELFRRGAEGGDTACMAGYATMLRRGQGGPALPAEGLSWLRRSAEAKDPAGLEGLAAAYRFGEEGLEVDLGQAFSLYREAAAGGRLSALRSLGTLHLKGQGTTKDVGEAFRCYRVAAEGGYLAAFHDLGLLYQKGIGTEVDLAAALHWMRRGAAGGDPLAMYALGVWSEQGTGVAKDLERARSWYRQAAEKGHPPATYNLAVHLGRLGRQKEAAGWYRKAAEAGYVPAMKAMGEILVAGEGLERDEAKARGFYQAAAKRGSKKAAYDLGLLLINGRGGERDDATGAEWVKRAADAGHPPAMGTYAQLLSRGRGVAKDEDEAWKWYRRGAERGESLSLYTVGLRKISEAEASGVELTPAQRQNAREGVQLLVRAARGGHPPAMYSLGQELRRGRFVPRDPKAAWAWFERGAGLGDLECVMGMATCRANGIGGPPDLAAARRLYQQAAEGGLPRAMGHFGTYLISGHGGPVDVERGVDWVKRGVEARDSFCMYTLGYLCDSGTGVATDVQAARRWYLEAAKAGNPRAMNNLARFMELGRGGPVDEQRALVWLRRAAEAGSYAAMISWGQRLVSGRGVPRDLARGRTWLRWALNAPDAEMRREAERRLAELDATSGE